MKWFIIYQWIIQLRWFRTNFPRDPRISPVLLYMENWATAIKSFMLVWQCHQLISWFLANSHLPRVSRRLIIRVIIWWNWRVCTDLMECALRLRKFSENLTRRQSSILASLCLKFGSSMDIHGFLGYGQNGFMLEERNHQLLSRFLANEYFPQYKISHVW